MAKKTELSIRISKIRAMFCDDDNRRFAQILGLNEQYASSICTGNKSAGKDLLNKILNSFPQISKAWLFLGEGEMLNNIHPSNNATGNNVGGNIVQIKNDEPVDKTDINRLITLLENKDKQIDRLIALLEERITKQ